MFALNKTPPWHRKFIRTGLKKNGYTPEPGGNSPRVVSGFSCTQTQPCQSFVTKIKNS